jgi:hypothetical protein
MAVLTAPQAHIAERLRELLSARGVRFDESERGSQLVFTTPSGERFFILRNGDLVAGGEKTALTSSVLNAGLSAEPPDDPQTRTADALRRFIAKNGKSADEHRVPEGIQFTCEAGEKFVVRSDGCIRTTGPMSLFAVRVVRAGLPKLRRDSRQWDSLFSERPRGIGSPPGFPWGTLLVLNLTVWIVTLALPASMFKLGAVLAVWPLLGLGQMLALPWLPGTRTEKTLAFFLFVLPALALAVVVFLGLLALAESMSNTNWLVL